MANPADKYVPLPPNLATLLGLPAHKKAQIRSVDLITQAIKTLQASGEIPDQGKRS